jgi:hypothetical protein
MTLVSLIKEEYEKNTSYTEGLVDYRAAGLLVSGCKRGKEQLERPVQSSYREKLNEDFLSTGRKISVTQVVLVSPDTRSKASSAVIGDCYTNGTVPKCNIVTLRDGSKL